MQRIATSMKAVDLFGAGKHGFRAGNPQAGISPTQFSVTWANAVQESILRAIELTGQTPAADHTQLAQALYLAGRDWHPDLLTDDGIFQQRTFRSHQTTAEIIDDWKYHEFTHYAGNVASGDSGFVALDVPDDSFFIGTVKCIISRTDLTSSQAGYIRAFHGRCISGSATISSTELYASAGTLAIDSTTLTGTVTGQLRFSADFNGTPSSKKYNMSAHWEIQVVNNFEA